MKRKTFLLIAIPTVVAVLVFWRLFILVNSPSLSSLVTAIFSVVIGLIIVFAFSFELTGSKGDE